MKRWNKCLMAGITALGLGVVCFGTNTLAQPAENTGVDCPMFMRDGGTGHWYPDRDTQNSRTNQLERWKEYRHKRQTALHDTLKLNAEQEKAWNSYLSIANANFNSWKSFSRSDFSAMTSPQRMQTMIDRMKERESKMTTQLSALKIFYAKLTPEQQKIFDKESLSHPRLHKGSGLKK